jgi:hypothetical protein
MLNYLAKQWCDYFNLETGRQRAIIPNTYARKEAFFSVTTAVTVTWKNVPSVKKFSGRTNKTNSVALSP